MAIISDEDRAKRDARELSRWEPLRQLGVQAMAEDAARKAKENASSRAAAHAPEGEESPHKRSARGR